MTLALAGLVTFEVSGPTVVGGIGKPEQLRHALAGGWSRRIDEEHRLVYLVEGDDIVILQARYHYG